MSTNFINRNMTLDIVNEEIDIDREEQLKVKLEVDSIIITGLKIANKIKLLKFISDILVFVSVIYIAFLLYFGFVSITIFNSKLIPTYGIAGLVSIFVICGIIQLVIYSLKIPLADIIDCIESRSEYNIYYKYAMLSNLMGIRLIKDTLDRSIFEKSNNRQDY